MSTPSNPIKEQQKEETTMEKPKTTNKDLILNYMEFKSPGLNSRRPITEEEIAKVKDTFDRFNDFKTIKEISIKTELRKERVISICFYLCCREELDFENRETDIDEFKNAKHGRAYWVFKLFKEDEPVRLIPNTPLFQINAPDSSRDRLSKALETLKENLERYGVLVSASSFRDEINIRVAGTPGGLLVAAKFLGQRGF